MTRDMAPQARKRPITAWIVAAMAAFALVPFLAADIPSMTDWAGHVGRFHVMLTHGGSATLDRFYVFDWHLVGNLGVDLFVWWLGPMFGAERAAWGVTALIPLLTIGGIAAVARAADGRIGPGAAIACCLVFGSALLFGFINFCLAVAIGLFAFAAWIAFRKRGRWLFLAVLAPLAFLTWLAHAMGWGVLVLMVSGFEAERLWHRRAGLSGALLDAATRGLALVPPLLLTLLWRSGGAGALFEYKAGLLQRKLMAWIVVLRGGSPWLDIGTVIVLAGLVAVLLWRGKLRIDWRIGAGAGLLAFACVVLPTTVFDSWGADERIAPVAVIIALLALRWHGTESGAVRLALLAGVLFAVRVGALALDWHALDAQYHSNLRALDHVAPGSRIQAMVLTNGCHAGWRTTAYPHLPDLAIVRRDAFVNAEWPMTGAPLLRVTYPVADALRYDPSQIVDAFDCAGRPTTTAIRARLVLIETARFDYVWMLDTRGRHDLWPGHVPLYRDATSELYAAR